jgi:hypothetical protein
MYTTESITREYEHIGVAVAVGIILVSIIIGYISSDKSAPKRPTKEIVRPLATPKKSKPAPRVKFETSSTENQWVNLRTGEIRVTDDDLSNDEEWSEVIAWESQSSSSQSQWY